MKLIEVFSKCRGVCDNNNEVSFVTNFTSFTCNQRRKVVAEYELLAHFHRRWNKQAAKEKQYVSILYLNPGKHTTVIKWQTQTISSHGNVLCTNTGITDVTWNIAAISQERTYLNSRMSACALHVVFYHKEMHSTFACDPVWNVSFT